MNTQTISTKDLRKDFSQVIEAMEEGRTLLLLYRSKPLAEIRPMPQKKFKTRIFSYSQLKEWIADDQLSEKEEREIETIIKRLP